MILEAFSNPNDSMIQTQSSLWQGKGGGTAFPGPKLKCLNKSPTWLSPRHKVGRYCHSPVGLPGLPTDFQMAQASSGPAPALQLKFVPIQPSQHSLCFLTFCNNPQLFVLLVPSIKKAFQEKVVHLWRLTSPAGTYLCYKGHF